MITSKITTVIDSSVEISIEENSVVAQNLKKYFELLYSFRPKIQKAKVQGLKSIIELKTQKIEELKNKLLKYNDVPLDSLDPIIQNKITYTQNTIEYLKEDVKSLNTILNNVQSKLGWNMYTLKGLCEKYLKEFDFEQKSTDRFNDTKIEIFTYNGDENVLNDKILAKYEKIKNILEERIEGYTTKLTKVNKLDLDIHNNHSL